MDILKMVDQATAILARYEAVKNQAIQFLEALDGLSVADKQKLYTILNTLGQTKDFEVAVSQLRALVQG